MKIGSGVRVIDKNLFCYDGTGYVVDIRDGIIMVALWDYENDWGECEFDFDESQIEEVIE